MSPRLLLSTASGFPFSAVPGLGTVLVEAASRWVGLDGTEVVLLWPFGAFPCPPPADPKRVHVIHRPWREWEEEDEGIQKRVEGNIPLLNRLFVDPVVRTKPLPVQVRTVKRWGIGDVPWVTHFLTAYGRLEEAGVRPVYEPGVAPLASPQSVKTLSSYRLCIDTAHARGLGHAGSQVAPFSKDHLRASLLLLLGDIFHVHVQPVKEELAAMRKARAGRGGEAELKDLRGILDVVRKSLLVENWTIEVSRSGVAALPTVVWWLREFLK